MKKNGHTTRKPRKISAFVMRAERALHRAARNIQTQNRALGLPVVVWKDGKVFEKQA
jgi:7,8-dihydro-6-hydroxymethylpterin-pyrophosphokinase